MAKSGAFFTQIASSRKLCSLPERGLWRKKLHIRIAFPVFGFDIQPLDDEHSRIEGSQNPKIGGSPRMRNETDTEGIEQRGFIGVTLIWIYLQFFAECIMG